MGHTRTVLSIHLEQLRLASGLSEISIMVGAEKTADGEVDFGSITTDSVQGDCLQGVGEVEVLKTITVTDSQKNPRQTLANPFEGSREEAIAFSSS